MITLLLADDQALVRGAMAALLGLEEDLEVVAEVGSGDEVVEAARRTRPDVAVLDVEMPGLDGITAAGLLREEVPGTKVLIVTTFGRPGYLRRALDAGASGFVVKDTPSDELAEAVRTVARGGRVVAARALRAAAKAAGLAYTAIPITHAGCSMTQVTAMIDALGAANGPVLAYCRTGIRSASLWSLAQAAQRPIAQIVEQAHEDPSGPSRRFH